MISAFESSICNPLHVGGRLTRYGLCENKIAQLTLGIIWAILIQSNTEHLQLMHIVKQYSKAAQQGFQFMIK